MMRLTFPVPFQSKRKISSNERIVRREMVFRHIAWRRSVQCSSPQNCCLAPIDIRSNEAHVCELRCSVVLYLP
jgi:hypothetical protein